MLEIPKIFIELWEAISKIADKLVAVVLKNLTFFWGIAVWLFEKFVDAIKYIADKL